MTEKESLKFNLLELVKEHRAKCTCDCNVSLNLVRKLAERAGLEFTRAERELFI